MRTSIRKCRICRIYTMREICPSCGKRTAMALPPRYSPDDRFGKYRRMLKRIVKE